MQPFNKKCNKNNRILNAAVLKTWRLFSSYKKTDRFFLTDRKSNLFSKQMKYSI